MVNKYYTTFQFAKIYVCLLTPNISYINWCFNYFQSYIYVANNKDYDIKIEMMSDYEEFKSNKYSNLTSNEIFELTYDNDFRNYIVYYHDTIDVKRKFMRLVRNIMLKELECRKYIFLHAACVSLSGIGVGIVGQKYAGKTTTCLSMLLGGFDFATNDKLALKPNEGEINAYGIPVSIGIREGTCKLYPDIILQGEKFAGEEKTFLTPTQLCNAFGSNIESSTSIRLFIVPSYNKTKDIITVTELNEREKQNIIDNQIIKSIYENYRIYNRRINNECDNKVFIKSRLAELKFIKIEQNDLSVNSVSDYVKKVLREIL